MFPLKIVKIIVTLLLFVSSIYYISNNLRKVEVTSVENHVYPMSSSTNVNLPIHEEVHQFDGLYSLIGMDHSQIIEKLGKPNRVDRSSYDYDWLVYNLDLNNYIQVGVENDRVVTVFGTGSDVQVNPFKIGQPLSELESKGLIKPEISLNINKNRYRFELTDEEQKSRPLIALGNVYVQLYIDTFTGKISSIRFLDGKTLIKLRPYELAYRGVLLSSAEISKVDWKKVEKGNSSQIRDLTNVIRIRHGIPPLLEDDKLASVAYLHSKDMRINEYFDHTSPTTGGLADRLAKGKVGYQLAGENIAAKYVDGIAAVEGWLNSKGHRETLLNRDYNYLGVGVYEKYYTQNFISKNELH